MTEVYQVWALGWALTEEGQECTDVEEFLGEFTDKAEAIAHAEKYKDMSYIYDADVLEDFDPEEFLEVRVEVLEPIPEDELDGTEEETWRVTDVCWSNNIYKPEV
jgi:hypothetical protein